MVTFVIGNGFDIQIGLNTKYTDFYKVYTQPKNEDNETIRRFKEEILKDDFQNWADFEFKMGEYSDSFQGDSSSDDFMKCFDDFVKSFDIYLANECDSINWSAIDEHGHSAVFRRSITNFFDYIKRGDKNNILHGIPLQMRVSFLQFNYTNAFDQMLVKSNLGAHLRLEYRQSHLIGSMGKNLHVHGSLKEGYITMGVDSVQQIANTSLRSHPDVSRIFVKSNFLDVQRARDRRTDIAADLALDVIKNSNIICSYGTSIGDTDKFWWKKIGEWLKHEHRKLIVFNFVKTENDRRSPFAVARNEAAVESKRKEFEQRFLRLAELGENWIEENPNKLIIELETDMFNFKLPRKTAGASPRPKGISQTSYFRRGGFHIRPFHLGLGRIWNPPLHGLIIIILH